MTTSVIALIGALVVSVATSGIGGGDVKLIGLITLSLGPNSWTAPGLAILYGFLFAAATTVVHALAARLRQRPRPATIPLGPYLLTGALTIALGCGAG